MNVQCGQQVKCWACTVTNERTSRYGRTPVSTWELYERAVEAIEAERGEFTIAGVWKRHGGGPAFGNAVHKAIRDMRLHGLVTCVRRVYAGRCLLWILNR